VRRQLPRRRVMEEHVLRVTFIEACEHPAGIPPFAAQQFSHLRVRLVRGGEHPGCGRVLQSRPQESAPDSVPPSACCDKEQVNEVALVEVAWLDAKKAHNFAVLHGHQAGLFADQGLDLLGPAGAVRIDGHDGADVFRLRCAQLSHACSIGHRRRLRHRAVVTKVPGDVVPQVITDTIGVPAGPR